MSADPEDSRALRWVVASGNADRVFDAVNSRLLRRRAIRLRMAVASIAIIVVGGLYIHFQFAGPSHSSPPISAIERPIAPFAPTALRTIATESVAYTPSTVVVSLPGRQLLPDGSVVDLRAGAAIAVHFAQSDTGLRRVDLESGEAHFQVAKNPNRPFIVSASGVEVRAVGTAFDVQINPMQVVVLVTEGKVNIALPSGAQVPSGLISAGVAAGQCLVISLRSGTPDETAPIHVSSMSSTEMSDRLAWRVPRLTFEGTPLAQAIPLFNQYANTHLVITDSGINDYQLSGVLRADNTDVLLKLLKDQFSVSADGTSDEIRLHK